MRINGNCDDEDDDDDDGDDDGDDGDMMINSCSQHLKCCHKKSPPNIRA